MTGSSAKSTVSVRVMPSRWLGAIGLVCAVAALAHATWIMVREGWPALVPRDWLSASLILESSVPSLVLAPCFLAAHWTGWRHKHRTSALWLAWAVFLLSLFLLIPQGPGKKPSSLRINERVVFSFDGDELIDINGLLRAQSIMPYMGDLEALEDKE